MERFSSNETDDTGCNVGSGKIGQETTHKAISDDFETPSHRLVAETSEIEQKDTCAGCGRKFLARISFDNFYCDDCYLSGDYLEPNYDDEQERCMWCDGTLWTVLDQKTGICGNCAPDR